MIILNASKPGRSRLPAVSGRLTYVVVHSQGGPTSVGSSPSARLASYEARPHRIGDRLKAEPFCAHRPKRREGVAG